MNPDDLHVIQLALVIEEPPRQRPPGLCSFPRCNLPATGRCSLDGDLVCTKHGPRHWSWKPFAVAVAGEARS
jgi:hypothetical protein